MSGWQTLFTETEMTANELRRLAQTRLDKLDHPFAPVNADFSADPQLQSGRWPSDYDLNPGMRTEVGMSESLVPAAVLVAIVAEPQPAVLLSERNNALRSHAGQIAFPGGKIDSTDRDPSQTAMREAYEEIGLDGKFIEPLGYLDCYETRTGYLVRPLVALIGAGYVLKLNLDEVTDCFNVPLSFLMNPDHHKRHSRFWHGKERYYYAIQYENRYIWGATAGIIRNMYERLAVG